MNGQYDRSKAKPNAGMFKSVDSRRTKRAGAGNAAMSQKISFWVDDLPPSLNKTMRNHWTKNRRTYDEWKERVGWLAKASGGKMIAGRAIVHFKIQTGDNRVHDADNMNASMKAPLDALKGILIEEDDIDHVELRYSYSRSKPRGFWVEVWAVGD